MKIASTFRASKTMAATLSALLCVLVLASERALAEDPLDRVSQALSVEVLGGTVRVKGGGLLDVEFYGLSHPAPALIQADDSALINPRLTQFLDVEVGRHIYGFVQARVDRGFDPADRRLQVRLDEYFVRVTPFDDGRNSVSVQAGKFATVVGNFAARHFSWENPFINAPLPYENITPAADREAPDSAEDFLGRRHEPEENYEYNPVVWGPSYTAGLAVIGTLGGRFDYAAEIKNAALSSRPEDWQPTTTGWAHPTGSARLGWRPGAAWNFGLSGSAGSYFAPDAKATLPAGRGIGDYRQFTLAQDISFAHGHWQFWAEFFETRFEVPIVGNADVFSYYLEAKYKMTAQLFGALRWNQQLFGIVPNGRGGEAVWGNDIWRIDGALGYRFTAHLQGKLQYSYSRQNSDEQPNLHLGALQLTVKY